MNIETRNQIQEVIKDILNGSDMVKIKIHTYPQNSKGEISTVVTLSVTTQNQIITKNL